MHLIRSASITGNPNFTIEKNAAFVSIPSGKLGVSLAFVLMLLKQVNEIRDEIIFFYLKC